MVALTSCKYGRILVYNVADIRDYKKFPALDLKSGEDTFYFHRGEDSLNHKISNFEFGKTGEKLATLDEFLDKETKTVAFLVIRNDSILFEKYFEKYNESSIVTSFSVAKSFVSALVNIAIQEGHLKGVEDPLTKYIPELIKRDQRFQNITIGHLLNMRSGLQFNESSYANPFSKITTLYYGKNHLRLVKKLKIKDRPDEKYEYQSVNTEILGIILERATGVKLATYFQEKIWKPLGMEYDASWSIDSKKNQNPKAYCCINARARDFAKLGKLYLNEGKWKGKQLIEKSWVEESTKPNVNNNFYQNHWYSTSKVLQDENSKTRYFQDSISAAGAVESPLFLVKKSVREKGKWYVRYASNSYMAVGVFGQYIYIDPDKSLMMLRFGKKNDHNYPELFSQIAEVL